MWLIFGLLGAAKQGVRNCIICASEPVKRSSWLTGTASIQFPNNAGLAEKLFGWLLNKEGLLSDKRKLWRWGERRCESFLKRKGFKKLARNFSCRSGEIDLVMVDGDGVIVFVEVKTRRDEVFGPAESSITSVQKARLSRAARYFLAVHNIADRPYRFDVVIIVLGRSGPVQIRHYENAFVA